MFERSNVTVIVIKFKDYCRPSSNLTDSFNNFPPQRSIMERDEKVACSVLLHRKREFHLSNTWRTYTWLGNGIYGVGLCPARKRGEKKKKKKRTLRCKILKRASAIRTNFTVFICEIVRYFISSALFNRFITYDER